MKNPSQLSTQVGLHGDSGRSSDCQFQARNVETESSSQSTESRLEEVLVVGPSLEPNEARLEETLMEDHTSRSSATELQEVIVEDPPSESNEPRLEQAATNNELSQSYDDECIICFKPHVDKTYVMDCLHTFCFNCIEAWYIPNGPSNRQ